MVNKDNPSFSRINKIFTNFYSKNREKYVFPKNLKKISITIKVTTKKYINKKHDRTQLQF